MADPLSDHYQELMEGRYDCVDRIVLNAYFGMAHSPGGFPICWRRLYGSDDRLDNAHLMRLASRFSRRLYTWAKAARVPVGQLLGRRKEARRGRGISGQP